MTTVKHSVKYLSPPVSVQSMLSNEFCGPEYNSTIVFSNDNTDNLSNAALNHDNDNCNNDYLYNDSRGSKTKRRCWAVSLIVKLRALSLLMFAGALFSLFLEIVAIVINNLVTFSNKTSIYYSNESGEINSTSRHLLIPEIDVAIGITSACVGAHCFARESMHGVIGLIPDETKVFSFLTSETQRIGFTRAREQFKLGFDTGVECGTSWFHVQRLTNFLLASLIITIVILAGCVAVTITLFSILTRVNALRGLVYHDPLSRLTIVGIKRDDAMYFLQKIKIYLWYERKLVIASAVVALGATIWGLITMIVMVMLVNRKMKCGSSVCASYTRSLHNLISLVVAPTSDEYQQNMHGVQCKQGPTFVLVIVVFVVTCLMLLFACVMLLTYTLSHRRERLRHRQLILEKFVHNQERPATTNTTTTSTTGISNLTNTPLQMLSDKLVPLIDNSTPQLTTLNNNSANINTTTETTTNTFTENALESSSCVPACTCAQNITRPHERTTSSSSSSCSEHTEHSSSFRSVEASRTQIENTQVILVSDTMELTAPDTFALRDANASHHEIEQVKEHELPASHAQHESISKNASPPLPLSLPPPLPSLQQEENEEELESVVSPNKHKAEKAKESWNCSENECEWSERERTSMICNGTPCAISITTNEHYLEPAEYAELHHTKKDNDNTNEEKHSRRGTIQSAYSYGQHSDHYSSRYNVDVDACAYSEGTMQCLPEKKKQSKVNVQQKLKLTHTEKEKGLLKNKKDGSEKMERSNIMYSATRQNFITESENIENNSINTNMPIIHSHEQQEHYCKEPPRKAYRPLMKTWELQNITNTNGHAIGAKSYCNTPLEKSCNREHEHDVDAINISTTESVPDNPLIYKKELAIKEQQRQQKLMLAT